MGRLVVLPRETERLIQRMVRWQCEVCGRTAALTAPHDAPEETRVVLTRCGCDGHRADPWPVRYLNADGEEITHVRV